MVGRPVRRHRPRVHGPVRVGAWVVGPRHQVPRMGCRSHRASRRMRRWPLKMQIWLTPGPLVAWAHLNQRSNSDTREISPRNPWFYDVDRPRLPVFLAPEASARSTSLLRCLRTARSCIQSLLIIRHMPRDHSNRVQTNGVFIISRQFPQD